MTSKKLRAIMLGVHKRRKPLSARERQRRLNAVLYGVGRTNKEQAR